MMSIKRSIVIMVLLIIVASCTKDPNPPVGYTFVNSMVSVTTYEPWGISQTSAWGEGGVTIYGSAVVTECGICWSTNHNPIISNNHVVSGSGEGMINCKMTGLLPETRYYCRAYAVSTIGTFYGNEESFSTLTYDGKFMVIGSASLSKNGFVYDRYKN